MTPSCSLQIMKSAIRLNPVGIPTIHQRPKTLGQGVLTIHQSASVFAMNFASHAKHDLGMNRPIYIFRVLRIRTTQLTVTITTTTVFGIR